MPTSATVGLVAELTDVTIRTAGLLVLYPLGQLRGNLSPDCVLGVVFFQHLHRPATDPLIDPLRKERRFQAIERELKFPG